MNRFIRVASAAIALSCLTTGVAVAQDRETVTVHVPVKGLDLTNPKHRAMLDARVMRAARWACSPRGADYASARASERCTQEMRDSGRVAMAALVTPNRTQLAGSRVAMTSLAQK